MTGPELPGQEGTGAPAGRPAHTRSVWRTALSIRRTQIGIGLVLLLVFVALVGPHIAPYSETAFVARPNSLPSGKALLGTDYLGQDVLSRFLEGGASILIEAFVATGLGVIAGAAIGLVSAYARNVFDDVLMRALDVILAFPPIMFALVAVATVGPKTWVVVLAVAVTTAPRVARVARGAAQPVIVRDFVLSAEALGMPRWRIVFGEVLPNSMAPLLVEATFRLIYSIGVIASLAFLGLTPDPDAANWGTMIQQNQVSLAVQPWGVVAPVVAIAVLMIGTALVGDGLSRASAGIERGAQSA